MADVFKGKPAHLERVDLSSLIWAAQQRIEQLQKHSPRNIIAFSGGKDSIVAAHLAAAAGITDAICEVSFCFPRDVTDFVKIGAALGLQVTWTHRLDMNWLRNHQALMFAEDQSQLYACRQQASVREIVRARGLDGVIFGRRRQENTVRRPVYQLTDGHWCCHPLFEWRTEHVWQYIEDNKLPYPSIYDHPIGQLEGADPFVGVSLEKAARNGLNGFDLIHDYDASVLHNIADWHEPTRDYLKSRGEAR